MKFYRYWMGFIVLAFLLTGSLPVMSQGGTISAAQTLRQKLTAADPTAGARFGASVAADGDVAVIGAPGAQVNGANRGAAYVFTRQGNTWTQVAQLTAADGDPGDLFGTAVAIQGSTIVVGAPSDDDAGGNAGAAYVFTGSGAGWTETQKLRPGSVGDTHFGTSLAIDGSAIAVGVPFTGSGFTNSGAAYIFDLTGGVWTQTVRLATGGGGAVLSDLFGWAVDLSGDTLFVGAYLTDQVFIFSRAAGWLPIALLSDNDVQASIRFGYALAADGARLLVGATHDAQVGTGAGAAFGFSSSSGGWLREAKLVPTQTSPFSGTNFGWSAALAGNVAVVGAANSKGLADAEESGAAYLYQVDGTTWRETAILVPADASPFDHFGTSVAISPNSILVGAPDDDGAGLNAGAVYVMSFTTSPPSNTAPVASPDFAETDAGVPVTIDVLANDTDFDGDPLTITNVTTPTNGTAVNNGDGTITYTPNAGFSGQDSFGYTISDGRGGQSSAGVLVTVNATSDNTPPTAENDSAVTEAGVPVTIDVLANDIDPDGDTLTVTDVSESANGSVVINDDQTITYTPNDGFSGQDNLAYTISDGRGGEAVAIIMVTVNAPSGNTPPTAHPDSATTNLDTSVTIAVLANDTDFDGDSLTVTDVTTPANGTAVDNGDGTITYTPNAGFSGQDSFSYTISDGQGGEASASVTVTVLATSGPPNPPPAPPGSTLVDTATTANSVGDLAGQFDILIAALLAADPAVIAALSGNGQYTVFAPTDAAFEAAGITLDNVGSQDTAALASILRYHVAPGRLDSNDVLSVERIRTLNGAFIAQRGGMLIDNQGQQANFIRTDVGAANGIIHVIDRVLMP